MRTVIRVVILLTFFFGGSYWQANHIQSMCESDDQPAYILGTQYLCLSHRHVQMLRHRSET